MAESLVLSVLEKLAPPMIHEFGLALDAKKDLRKLETTFLTIKDVLEDAESQSMKDKVLFNWLAKLEDATYDMEDLLDYVETERRKLEIHGHMIKKVRCFFSRSNPIIFRFKISHRVKEMRERLDEISANRSKFHLKKREANDRKMEIEEVRETWSTFDEKSICGRDDDIETIVSFLLETNNEEEDVLILSIVGMGGLGKTTLAQLVYNDERVKRNEQFELRRWVYVSEVFNPKKIMKDILSATGQSCNQDNLESIGIKLKDLLREKKFLLVLDDVWNENENENEWEKLKSIFNVGKRGSRIIVTTRSGEIASIMKNTTPHNLEKLSDEDCWKLIKQKALDKESEERNSKLVQIGREIAKKCGGVPLAAKALGSTLRSMKKEEEWLAVRDSDIWKVVKKGDQILASLRLSYTYLLPPVKQCFAYCSLFPKGYEFDKEILISQWIAQGFVRPVDGSPPMEIIANTYFNDLLWISFFQKSKYAISFEMHDLINDLARFVAGNKVLVEKTEKAMTGLTMGCRYVALMGNIASTIAPANNLKKIRALHVFNNRKEFPESIVLSSAKCLRTLDLSGYGRINSLPKLSNLRYIRASILQVEMLPEYICGLRNLQFVYLSDCGSLRTLPESIGNLCNLRNLKLIGCGSELEPFPDSFANLEHLVSLDLSESKIELLPIKSFGRLPNLQSINLSRCESLKELPDSIGDAKNLRSLNMEGCYCLGALPESTSNLTRLESLNLGRCGELHELPKGLGKMRSLKHLNIRGCDGLCGMPRGMRQMTNLETLPLFVVGKEEGGGFASIGELEHLNHIEGELCIRNVERVRNCTDATKANLKEKRKLHSLVLLWNREEEGGDEIEEGVVECLQPRPSIEEGGDEIEEGVLECLQPPPSIKTLKIEGYGGRKIPSWLASSASLPNVPAAVFPSLTELVFIANPNLEEWTTEEAATLFPRLKKLLIRKCPKLKARPWIPASVEELSIMDSSRDEELLSDTSLQSSSRLKTLNIKGSGISSSANVQWTGLRHLASSLHQLRISFCREVRCLPESIRHLASLQQLFLDYCEKLSEIGEWVGELQSLRSLYISRCPGLTSLPNGMRHLKLDDLFIHDCLGLKEIPEWVGELQSLCFLSIRNCPGLTSLPNGMRHLALDHLVIDDCPGLKEIPEWVGELQSLRSLDISGCPGLSSLPNGMRHLALEKLTICGCPGLKEIPEWVGELQSLRSLYIYSCPGLTSLPNGMRHLKLDDLFISGCLGLKEIPEWVGELQSLRSLEIGNCPGLTSLPNGMRHLALDVLIIRGCPGLKERCERERGEDWHLISHIPNITLSLVN